MKRQLKDKCRKCGGQIWYIYKRGRRCVLCSHTRALTARTHIKRLEAHIKEIYSNMFIVNGKDEGIPVTATFQYLKHAERFAKTLTESEIYDTSINMYISGTSPFMQQLLKLRQDPTHSSIG